MRRGKRRAIHTFGEVVSVSRGKPYRIEIKRLLSDKRLCTIQSEKYPERGVVWMVIVPFSEELSRSEKGRPYMIAELANTTIKEGEMIATFDSIDGNAKVEIYLDDRGRARNLIVGREYIFDIMDRREFFEVYERGSIPVGIKGKRSEPDKLGDERIRNFIQISNVREGQKALDMATGIKDYLGHFLEKGCYTICANISVSILKRTRGAIGNKNAAFVAYDVEKGFPFKNETFDVVVCDALLEYVSRPHEVLKRTFHLIKRGGRLLLLEPIKPSTKIPDFYPQNLWEIALWRPIYDPYFNEDCVEETLKEMGFDIVEKRAMRFTYPIYDEEQFSQSVLSLQKPFIS